MRKLLCGLAFSAALWPVGLALADNCSSQGDCEQTAGYNTAVAVVGGFMALGAGLIGTSLSTSEDPPRTTGNDLSQSKPDDPPARRIKANSKSGIYHRPGERYYAQTVQAVEWFDTDAAAEAAGFRAATPPANLAVRVTFDG
jgi:hypothetical protein